MVEKNNKEFVPVRPDYKGDGVAVWKSTDIDGKEYLKIKILNSIIVRAFSPKVEEKRAS